MTWKEKLEKEHPHLMVGIGGCFGCPHTHFKEATRPVYCDCGKACERCWSRTIPEPTQDKADEIERQMIKRALNSVYGSRYGTLASKPEAKSCSSCIHLEKSVNQEPCKSCNSLGCVPTNWKPKDDHNSLGFDPNDITTWYPKSLIVTGRRNGKNLSMQHLIYSMLAAGDPVAIARKQHHDGLSAHLYAIDELHNVRNEERKTDMPTSSINGKTYYNAPSLPEIERVIFSDPATIVFWRDKTKTVVKANNEEYDPEKGLAMAMLKKLYGNKGNYCNKLKRWTDEYHGRYPGEEAAEKAEKTRRDLALAEAMLETVKNADSKMTKAEMRAYVSDALKLVGEALED